MNELNAIKRELSKNRELHISNLLQDYSADLAIYLAQALDAPNENKYVHQQAMKLLKDLPGYPHNKLHHKNILLQVLTMMIFNTHDTFRDELLKLRLLGLEFIHPEFKV